MLRRAADSLTAALGLASCAAVAAVESLLARYKQPPVQRAHWPLRVLVLAALDARHETSTLVERR